MFAVWDTQGYLTSRLNYSTIYFSFTFCVLWTAQVSLVRNSLLLAFSCYPGTNRETAWKHGSKSGGFAWVPGKAALSKQLTTHDLEVFVFQTWCITLSCFNRSALLTMLALRMFSSCFAFHFWYLGSGLRWSLRILKFVVDVQLRSHWGKQYSSQGAGSGFLDVDLNGFLLFEFLQKYNVCWNFWSGLNSSHLTVVTVVHVPILKGLDLFQWAIFTEGTSRCMDLPCQVLCSCCLSFLICCHTVFTAISNSGPELGRRRKVV